MGLLDRAGSLNSEQAQSVSALDKAKRILTDFTHAPEHLDFPVQVFTAFSNTAGISRGALMFPNNALQEFHPWMIKNLDRTSSRRLRMPFNFPPFERFGTHAVCQLQMEELESMLSVREAGFKSSPMLFRVGGPENPAALILALDCELNETNYEDIHTAVSLLADNLLEDIRKNRRIMDMEEDSLPHQDAAEWLHNHTEHPGVLAILDISHALDALIEKSEGIELYRARQDIVNLLRRITGRMGRFLDLKDGRVLILFPSERLPDQTLYIHQLTQSFMDSVSGLSEPPQFPAEFFNWPDEDKHVKKALSGFFTE
ncbi:MAG: hypothetical protein CSA76_00030 [Spirochaetales bacterium]|nr:MAG: hypothetical protein CSA76_00030 [Spirochaetales bacterium]